MLIGSNLPAYNIEKYFMYYSNTGKDLRSIVAEENLYYGI